MLKFFKGGLNMNKKEKTFIFLSLKFLWLYAILFGFLALRLELLVHDGFFLRLEVDATYMLDSLVATSFILGLTSFLCIKYI